jgi:hypothetical protein
MCFFDIAAVATGTASAFFWFWSSKLDSSIGWGGVPTAAIKKAAKLNTLAAAFSALSILSSNGEKISKLFS